MNQVAFVIERFGGLRKLARALDIPSSTVSSWGDYIPARHHPNVLSAAIRDGVPLTADELVNPPKLDDCRPSDTEPPGVA